MPTSPSSAARAERKPAPRPAAAPRQRRLRGILGGAGLAAAGALALFFLLQATGGRPAFDRDLAFKHLERQVAFGPRVPNLPSHDQCRDYLVDTLKPLADSVERQDFTQTIRGKRLRMSNIV
ncbi:MAG TPA: hypothetical protein VFU47_14210, partial [Armatimonadota bacterium]|nr:hypothetical protein [Armatimonadota bacterium]